MGTSGHMNLRPSELKVMETKSSGNLSKGYGNFWPGQRSVIATYGYDKFWSWKPKAV